ncbi:MAG: TetR/AcrR family transcriptional regulator [Bacteriovoracaceae bacterium]|jgi:AcrR family transcriptional regulator|nr:TetR/AcrR family transcriptional regulator [Bacteriovoracaceae bacterium]
MSKEKIFKAARQLIENKGAGALSMRKMATSVGLSAMATYKHYPSKDFLLLEVAAVGFEELASAGIQSAEGSVSKLDQIEKVLLAYFDYGITHAHLFELMFGAIREKKEISSRFSESAAAGFQQFAAFTYEYVGQEKMKTESFNFQSAYSLWAAIHGITTLVASGYMLPDLKKGMTKSEMALELIRPTLKSLKE